MNKWRWIKKLRWDCTNSILRLEQMLKIRNTRKVKCRSHGLSLGRFFVHVVNWHIFTLFVSQNLFKAIICGSQKHTIRTSKKIKTTPLSDCFVELIKRSPENQIITTCSNYDFKPYLLHPNYKGKGLLSTVFRDIYLLAMKIWVNMGGGETTSAKLISQIRLFT
ncbi:unnamed protein product [Rhizophagus irregularis]|nr:unnamed protein product [Rhizophagus irregularis]